jgi:glutamyl-tRNA reductase
LDEAGLRRLLSEWARHRGQAAIELAVLSTCNRIEAYATLGNEDAACLRTMLLQTVPGDGASLLPYLYQLTDAGAARHLLEVACGLDSMVLGEPQILGQVAAAHRLSQQAGASGAVLNRLFQAAAHAGKRARTETAIARHPSSVASVAVELAAGEVEDISRAQVLVVGAGHTSELVVEALRKRSAAAITVINRTAARAHELAGRWRARARPLAEIGAALEDADIVIASTGAPQPIVTAEMVRRARRVGRARALVLIDLAVPRDVDPHVGEIPGTRLFDLDHLKAKAADGLEVRHRETPRVRAILEEELADFLSWWRARALAPTIAGLHRQAEAIRQREVARSLRRLPDLDDRARARIEAMSRALVRKLLHAPTLSLVEAGRNGLAQDARRLADRLFGLPEDCTDGRPPADREDAG